MVNHLMRYKGQRGLEYKSSLSKGIYPKCGQIGYIQLWYSCLGSYCFSAAHVGKRRRSKYRKSR